MHLTSHRQGLEIEAELGEERLAVCPSVSCSRYRTVGHVTFGRRTRVTAADSMHKRKIPKLAELELQQATLNHSHVLLPHFVRLLNGLVKNDLIHYEFHWRKVVGKYHAVAIITANVAKLYRGFAHAADNRTLRNRLDVFNEVLDA